MSGTGEFHSGRIDKTWLEALTDRQDQANELEAIMDANREIH